MGVVAGDEQGTGTGAALRVGRHRRPRPLVLVAMVAALLAGLGALVVGPTIGSAAPAPVRRTCDQYGSLGVSGDKYVIQNNRWGAATEQCISENGPTGFVLDSAQHTNKNGPAGYPSIYRGCNYGYCTVGSPFPAQVSKLGTVRSSWVTGGPTAATAAPTTTAKATTTTKAATPTTTKPGTAATPGTTTAAAPTTTAAPAPAQPAQYNTAYDIWFNKTNASVGRNDGAEMMIWLNRTSWVQPIGRKYLQTTIAGTRWDVWYGILDGLPVISYVRTAPVTSVSNLPIEDFVRDAQLRGVVKPAWFLTSVQAGFEPWTGGTGLKTTSFSVTRNGQ